VGPIRRRFECSFPFPPADIDLGVFVFEQVIDVVEVQAGDAKGYEFSYFVHSKSLTAILTVECFLELMPTIILRMF